jgi:hypothetical protein
VREDVVKHFIATLFLASVLILSTACCLSFDYSDATSRPKALAGANRTDGGFFIKHNDRAMFLGDTITQQKLYTTYIEAYALTRFPKYKPM